MGGYIWVFYRDVLISCGILGIFNLCMCLSEIVCFVYVYSSKVNDILTFEICFPECKVNFSLQALLIFSIWWRISFCIYSSGCVKPQQCLSLRPLLFYSFLLILFFYQSNGYHLFWLFFVMSTKTLNKLVLDAFEYHLH